MDNRFDMSDVRRLERHLARAIPRARRDARMVTRRGAMNIKRDWKSNARSSAPKHAPLYPSSIGFDFAAYGPDIFMAIIGPDKGGPQGALGNLLDRARLGYVIDFVDAYWGVHHWPAFNVADSAISIGVVLLVIDILRQPQAGEAAQPPRVEPGPPSAEPDAGSGPPQVATSSAGRPE